MNPRSRSKGFELLGHTDQGGRSDGAQVMVADGYAYVGQLFSGGISIIDVRDPRAPKPVGFIESPPNTWSPHLQLADGLLLVVDEYDFYKSPVVTANYYLQSTAESVRDAKGHAFGRPGQDFAAGFRVYDVSAPGRPRLAGTFRLQGLGCHRIWYVGGRYAYVSALVDGYSDHIFLIVDLGDPAVPVEVGRWWIPGMADGEDPATLVPGRTALHHAIVADGIAYGSWRDGGLTLLDVKDPSSPRLLSHRNWHPPFGGGTHTALPLTGLGAGSKPYAIVADEAVLDNCADQLKHIWVFDVRDSSNPVSVATFPTPSEEDYCAKPGRFGPHNLHENRPGSFQSSDLIFATYQNAGLRAFDISDPLRPSEVASFVPHDQPELWADTRGADRSIHSVDTFVSADGLVYLTDMNLGMHILQFNGA